PRGVRSECRRVDLRLADEEEVDAVESPRQLARALDLLTQRVCGEVAGRDEAEAAGVRHGGGELRRRRAARERRLHDRIPEGREGHPWKLASPRQTRRASRSPCATRRTCVSISSACDCVSTVRQRATARA